jgi:plasmid stability protein
MVSKCNREGIMTSITIRNIPDDLYAKFKELAAANQRSINSELIVAIERAVAVPRIDPKTFLAEVRQLRELTADYVITDDELDEWKREGRL